MTVFTEAEITRRIKRQAFEIEVALLLRKARQLLSAANQADGEGHKLKTYGRISGARPCGRALPSRLDAAGFTLSLTQGQAHAGCLPAVLSNLSKQRSSAIGPRVL